MFELILWNYFRVFLFRLLACIRIYFTCGTSLSG